MPIANSIRGIARPHCRRSTTVFRRARAQFLVTLAALASAGACAEAIAKSADPSPQAIERAVEKLLKTHPELVLAALNQSQQRPAADTRDRDRQLLAASQNAIYETTDSIVLGNPTGDVTLVEFIDYRCGYCQKLSTNLDALIARDGQLRVLVKQLPILGPESIAAAQRMASLPPGDAALAAQVHQRLMTAESLDAASLAAIDQSLHLDAADLRAANRSLGEVRVLAERLGIQGTPALVLGDTLYRGAPGSEELSAAIGALRLAAKGAAPRKSAGPSVPAAAPRKSAALPPKQ